jgi:UV DNA damage repair endonuclease
MEQHFFIGYEGENLTLFRKDFKFKKITNKQFEKHGLDLVYSVINNNINVLLKVFEWNMYHGIYNYSLPFDFFPVNIDFNINDLPKSFIIKRKLRGLGSFIKINKLRVSIQTSKSCKLSSNVSNVALSSKSEIDKISSFFDYMGLPAIDYYTIITFVGGSYNNKYIACDRFCELYFTLSENARKRLALTNDYKTGGYTVQELYNLLYLRIRTPIVFNKLYHDNLSGHLSEKEALNLSLSTWENSIKPLVHYMDSRNKYEDDSAKKYESSDKIYSNINNYNYDVIVFSGMNEMSVLTYKINNNYLYLSNE